VEHPPFLHAKTLRLTTRPMAPRATASRPLADPTRGFERCTEFGGQNERLNAGVAHVPCRSCCCGVQDRAGITCPVGHQARHLGDLVCRTGMLGDWSSDDDCGMSHAGVIYRPQGEPMTHGRRMVAVPQADEQVCLGEVQRNDSETHDRAFAMSAATWRRP